MGTDYPFHSEPFGHYAMDPRVALHCRFWARLFSVAQEAGVVPLCKRPGIWSVRVNDDWTLHVNAHAGPLFHGVELVPPGACLVRHRGRRAGILNPLDYERTLPAGMEDLVAALERLRIQRVFATGKGASGVGSDERGQPPGRGKGG